MTDSSYVTKAIGTAPAPVVRRDAANNFVIRSATGAVERVPEHRPDIAQLLLLERARALRAMVASPDLLAREVVAPLLAHLRAHGVRVPPPPTRAPARRSGPSAAQRAALARAQRALARADAALRS